MKISGGGDKQKWESTKVKHIHYLTINCAKWKSQSMSKEHWNTLTRRVILVKNIMLLANCVGSKLTYSTK